MRRWIVRIGKGLALVCGLLALGLAGLALWLRHPLPTGTPGPAADELARHIERAVDIAAWRRTGAVRWNYAGRQQHLWDRVRNFDRVRFRDVEVLLDIGPHRGLVFQRGARVEGAAATALVDEAWKWWANDSFWLNPLWKLFDEGVVRQRVTMDDGAPALLVGYLGKGGVTPGDHYLWILDRDGRPRAWRMWVSILPVGGIETKWDGWTRLATGALVATTHAPLPVKITELAGAATLAELEPGGDPFAALLDQPATR